MSRPLGEVLASLGAPRLLVAGDLILDRYLAGAVDRISPEAPIQVLRVDGETVRLGGAGSVAVNVAVLGARTTLVGVVGVDRAADRLEALAREAGVRLDAVRDPSRRTSVKTRHLARTQSVTQQVLRVDEETVTPAEAPVREAVLRRLLAALDEADAVCVSDYGKGALGPDVLVPLLEAGRARGLPVVVDPKGDDFSRYRGATVLTPNRAEVERGTGIAVPRGDDAAAERAATALLEDLELDFALITLDREGMYLKAREPGPGLRLRTTPREVFDVTGAGDMVLSVLAMALASGATPPEAAALANVAAGLEVQRFGVVPLTREEIAHRLSHGADVTATKEVAPDKVSALVERLRAADHRIVFTNGCFDVLHAGHVRFLQAARNEGDVLIVGLNDDASVRRLKGEGRPVNGVEDRIVVLSALAAVDHVVVFGEDTPASLVDLVRPDVLAKGEDWADQGVVGRDTVEAHGGRVVLLPLLEGRSTTDVIGRIRSGPGA